MLLSEAIRLGATMGPQLFVQLGDGKGGTCAIGAAGLSAGCLNAELTEWDHERGSLDLMVRMFPILRHLPSRCPGEGCDFKGVWTFLAVVSWMIVHLNNDHRWTRERIADWVEEQEVALGMAPAAEDDAPVPEPVPVGAAS